MRYFLNICTFALGILFVGCSDDDGVPATELEVISNTAKFDAAGGEGKILVQSPSAIIAVAEEDWCTVSVSGMTVNVVVPVNQTIMGRTAMVAISAGGETLRVPVYQAGDIFICDLEDSSFPMTGGSRAFSLKTAREVTVTECPEWLSYEFNDGGIEFTATAADSDRSGKVSITVEKGNSVTATFRQWSVEGTYSLSFEDDKGAPGVGSAVVSKRTDGTLDIRTTGMVINATLNASYSEETCQIVLSCGQVLGTVSGYTVVVCGLASDGYVSWNTNVQYVASARFDDETGKVKWEFHDNGTWTGKTLVGLHYGGFDSADSYASGFGSAYNLVMTKQ